MTKVELEKCWHELRELAMKHDIKIFTPAQSKGRVLRNPPNLQEQKIIILDYIGLIPRNSHVNQSESCSTGS